MEKKRRDSSGYGLIRLGIWWTYIYIYIYIFLFLRSFGYGENKGIVHPLVEVGHEVCQWSAQGSEGGKLRALEADLRYPKP